MALAILLTGGIAPSAPAEIVDRIVATVNGHIILQSDWDEALSYEALLNGRVPSDFSEEERKQVLDRLIDQELLAEQVKSDASPHASEAEAEARIAEARKQYADAATPQGWEAVLARFHLTQKDLVSHVQKEIDLMRLVDAHLRPEVQIDSKSIEAYYRDRFVPQLKQAGAGDVSLAEVSGKIRELLTEQRVNELLVSWLQSLRSEGSVSFPGFGPPAGEGTQTR
ncbi:MAG TPA: SurA N-terminal domain-containing protein [Verrucomicrobiae bacterium]|nr:SurA N-terminal domain-containing protein [Verrucomicrobiae bacterium]